MIEVPDLPGDSNKERARFGALLVFSGYNYLLSMRYTLKRSGRARAMRISVHPDGAVVVTAPLFFALGAIERFVAQHSEWVRSKVEGMKGRRVIRIARSDIGALKKRALLVATERAAHFAALYGVEHGRISIRAQKSRWGSCTKEGHLSFNYKIAALPQHLADYIFVHEICHILELNHSKKFWAQVARTMPDHGRLKKELRNTVILFS